MNTYKVLSIDPGSTSQVPTFESYARPASISPIAGRLMSMRMTRGGIRAAWALLTVRAVAAIALTAGAWMQLNGAETLLGLRPWAMECAWAAMALAAMILLGVAGRGAALAAVALCVTAAVGDAASSGGVATLTASCQLSLAYGALSATVVALGTGGFTLTRLVRGLLRRR